MTRPTGLAQTIDLAADRARYDECAKKLLTYNSIIAWILKSCTKEFAQYSISFIAENCLKDRPEISQKAVHPDQLDRQESDLDQWDMDENRILDGDRRMDGLNTEANSIKQRTIFYDIRFRAYVPGGKEAVQLIINLEIQLNDTPGYPLVKRGFYYCARMISEQYGTVFTDEHYEDIQKVYSIWICPDPAKRRKNGIFKYHTVEEAVHGTSCTKQESYDLMEVVILNLGDASKKSDQEILDLLNVLFSADTPPEEKKKKLREDFQIAMTAEFESEVGIMCNLSQALVAQGMQQGIQQGIQQGEELLAQLIQKLFALGRAEDVRRVAEDQEYRNILMKELL